MEEQTLKAKLRQGDLDGTLRALYGASRLEAARSRCYRVLDAFAKAFEGSPSSLFSAPGRTELGGNHTDHERGRVLAAGVDLDILAAAAPNHSGILRIQSEGYPQITVDLGDLAPKPEEKNTSAALIRGVAARMAELGCPLAGMGLDAYMVSDVPGGSGLSSSAAFEVLIGVMLNDLFWNGRCTPVEIAQIGQYAENVFFGKPCGLMDQAASSVGDVVFIDFADRDHPSVEQITLDLKANRHALCVLDSGADHADLTDEYAAVTRELRAVCQYFGKEVLREVPEESFLAALPQVRQAAGDRGALRAFHIYEENRRAAAEAGALRSGDFASFLSLVRESGRSSAMYLQNVIPTGQTTHQELMLAIALAERLLNGRGAVRVHGGGFAGTAQAFVPEDCLEDFKSGIESVFGPGSCHVVTIRPVGGLRLDTAQLM